MIKRELQPVKKPKLLIFVGNPTQYHSPIFRGLSNALNGALEVLYGDSIGAEPFYSEELQSTVKWDVPILEGFPYKIFKNRSPSSLKGFWSRNNPSLISHVYKSPAKYVLIHGYDTVSSWYVYFAALVSRKKIIWRGEAVARPGKQPFTNTLLKKLILPFYFFLCYRVLYSCSNNRDYLSRYVYNTKKFVSFPCAVDNGFFQNNAISKPEERIKLRKDIGFQKGDFIFATCSRLTKRKRTDMIISAISEMKNKSVGLLVIGDGPERENLETLAKNKNVKLSIIGFVGQREVARYLSISNAFTLMSKYDASPKALNEALSFRIPLIVSSGVGTARDLVLNEKNGWIITPKHERHLTKFFEKAVNSPKLKKSILSHNKKILSAYSIEEDIRKLIGVIKNG